MEVRIGVVETPREVVLESKEEPAAIVEAVQHALTAGTMLDLVDDKGRRVLVPGSRIAYVEVGPAGQRKVGFGAL